MVRKSTFLCLLVAWILASVAFVAVLRPASFSALWAEEVRPDWVDNGEGFDIGNKSSAEEALPQAFSTRAPWTAAPWASRPESLQVKYPFRGKRMGLARLVKPPAAAQVNTTITSTTTLTTLPTFQRVGSDPGIVVPLYVGQLPWTPDLHDGDSLIVEVGEAGKSPSWKPTEFVVTLEPRPARFLRLHTPMLANPLRWHRIALPFAVGCDNATTECNSNFVASPFDFNDVSAGSWRRWMDGKCSIPWDGHIAPCISLDVLVKDWLQGRSIAVLYVRFNHLQTVQSMSLSVAEMIGEVRLAMPVDKALCQEVLASFRERGFLGEQDCPKEGELVLTRAMSKMAMLAVSQFFGTATAAPPRERAVVRQLPLLAPLRVAPVPFSDVWAHLDEEPDTFVIALGTTDGKRKPVPEDTFQISFEPLLRRFPDWFPETFGELYEWSLSGPRSLVLPLAVGCKMDMTPTGECKEKRRRTCLEQSHAPCISLETVLSWLPEDSSVTIEIGKLAKPAELYASMGNQAKKVDHIVSTDAEENCQILPKMNFRTHQRCGKKGRGWTSWVRNIDTMVKFKRLWQQKAEAPQPEGAPEGVRLLLGVFSALMLSNEVALREAHKETWMQRPGVCWLRLGQRPGCSVYTSFVLGQIAPRNFSEEELVLPINENMNEGKTYEFFHAAAQQFPWVTHIAKMDLDTFPYTSRLIWSIHAHLNDDCEHFAGRAISHHGCGDAKKCPEPTRCRNPQVNISFLDWNCSVFMTGELYLMSTPLAAKVTASGGMWSQRQLGHEDRVTSHMVKSFVTAGGSDVCLSAWVPKQAWDHVKHAKVTDAMR